MKQLNIGQTVVVPGGREGKVRAINGNEITIWFTEDGTDSGIYALTTLKFPPTKLVLVKRG